MTERAYQQGVLRQGAGWGWGEEKPVKETEKERPAVGENQEREVSLQSSEESVLSESEWPSDEWEQEQVTGFSSMEIINKLEWF